MKPSNTYKYILILVGLLFLSFTIFLLVKTQRFFSQINTEISSELESENYEEDLSNISSISSIEGNAEFKFPPSSRDIYSYTTGLRDIYIQVRFTIDIEDLPKFIESTRCDLPLDDFMFSDVESSSIFSWWEVSKSRNLKRCSGVTDNFSQEVLVDMAHREFYVIYVTGSTH